MSLVCDVCGTNAFRLRRADGGAEAECITCGAVIPNAVLRAATRLPPADVPTSESSGREKPLLERE
jgi:hypothetical protein